MHEKNHSRNVYDEGITLQCDVNLKKKKAAPLSFTL